MPLLCVATGLSFAAGFLVQQRGETRFPWSSPAVRFAQASEGQVAAGNRPPATAAGQATRGAERPEDAAAAYQTFETVYGLVREHYVDALPSDTQMSYGSVRSLLSRLNDPHCFFLEPDQRTLFENEAHGHYAGIGAVLAVRALPRDGYTDHKVVVVSPLPDSPADRAGLRSGDVITHVNNRWILGSDPYLRYNRLVQRATTRGANPEGKAAEDAALNREEEAARRRVEGGIGLLAAQFALRGDEKTLTQQHLTKSDSGSYLTLTIERPGATVPLKRTLALTPVEALPVSVRTLEGRAAYVRVAAFTDQTVNQFRAALAGFPSLAGGLILDLRGNAGGTGRGDATALNAAEAIDAALTTSGGVFALQAESGGRKSLLRSSGATAAKSPFPAIVVLLNRGTAGTAEALAASLRDKGAATLAGEQTFGNALVQTQFPLPDGSAFVLTTGRLSSPRHTEWAGKGLSPSAPIAAGASETATLARAVRVLKSAQFALSHRRRAASPAVLPH